LTGLAAAAGGMALALVGAAGPAYADPTQPGQWSQNPAVNTNCTYFQVVSAMNVQSPEAAAQFNATPMAQSFLQNFLASPPAQREQMLEQAQAVPEAAQYVNLVGPIAKTCEMY
jgi:hemophore-related protein